MHEISDLVAYIIHIRPSQLRRGMTVHLEFSSSTDTQLSSYIRVPSWSENWTVYQGVSLARSWLFLAVTFWIFIIIIISLHITIIYFVHTVSCDEAGHVSGTTLALMVQTCKSCLSFVFSLKPVSPMPQLMSNKRLADSQPCQLQQKHNTFISWVKKKQQQNNDVTISKFRFSIDFDSIFSPKWRFQFDSILVTLTL